MSLVYPSAIGRAIDGLMAYDPERIILFGSAARGEADEYSDLDLIVIKKTDKRFVERLVEAGSLIPLDLTVDILVYTPEEFQSMIEARNPFIEEALKDGKVLYYYLATRHPDAVAAPAVPFQTFARREAEHALGYAEEIVATVRASLEVANQRSAGPAESKEGP